MSTFESYASKSSADCASEFGKATGDLSLWSLVLVLETINPYIKIVLDEIWPVASYL